MPQNKTKPFRSFSSRETKEFAKKIAKIIKKAKARRGAVVIALYGDLGSGKTTFVQGLLRTLGVRKKITSPTFVVVKRFKIQDLRFKNIYHVDAYRLKGVKELEALGLKEILNDPKNIVLIEWAERVGSILPESTIRLRFSHGKNERERAIRLR